MAASRRNRRTPLASAQDADEEKEALLGQRQSRNSSNSNTGGAPASCDSTSSPVLRSAAALLSAGRSSRRLSKASRLSITADNAYEYQESDDEKDDKEGSDKENYSVGSDKEGRAAGAGGAEENKEGKDEEMTWKSFVILGVFVAVLVSQAVSLRSTLNNSKVMSQSVPVTVGVCACVTYFTISVLVTAFGGAAEAALLNKEQGKQQKEREGENAALESGNGGDIEDPTEADNDEEDDFNDTQEGNNEPSACAKICYGLKATFDLRKIWEYFPSALFFGCSQALLTMGPLFVGPGLRNLFGQSKIPLSMLFSLLILGKKHNVKQWIIICCLAVAVAMFGMLQKAAKESGDSDGDASSSVKIVFGLIVVLLGSAAAVLGGTLQEKMMKKEKNVSIFTQKFQTDISQIFVTLGMFFLLPFLGQGLDLLQEACFADAKPENMQLRQSPGVYRGVVITVTDGLSEGKEFYENSLRKFESEKESEVDFLHDYYEAELRGDKHYFWSGEFLAKDERKGKKVPKDVGSGNTIEGKQLAKYDSAKRYSLPDGATNITIKERKSMPHVKALLDLKKKLDKLANQAAKSPYKKNLRMVAPSEWKRKVSIGGLLNKDQQPGKAPAPDAAELAGSSSPLWTVAEQKDAELHQVNLAKDDIRGVYHRIDLWNDKKLGDYAFCKVDQNLKSRVAAAGEDEVADVDGEKSRYLYFAVEACLFKEEAHWVLYAARDTAKAGQMLKLRGAKNSTVKEDRDKKTFQAHLLADDNAIDAKVVNGALKMSTDEGKIWKPINFQLTGHAQGSSALDHFLDHVSVTTEKDGKAFIPRPNHVVPLRAEFRLPRSAVFAEADLKSETAKNHAPEAKFDMPRPDQVNGYELDGVAQHVGNNRSGNEGTNEDAAAAGFFLIDLHIREGPIAAGVVYSGSYNDPKYTASSYVCDDIRCNGSLWQGYPYMQSSLHDKLYKVHTSPNGKPNAAPGNNGLPFINETSGATDYESGFFAGWTYMIVLAVGFTMAQYFLNALVNKFVSVIWNKIAHTVATVVSFWFGEMLFDNDPETEFSAVQLSQLAMLSVLVFSSIVLFLLSKEDAKKDKQKDKALEEKGVELADKKAPGAGEQGEGEDAAPKSGTTSVADMRSHSQGLNLKASGYETSGAENEREDDLVVVGVPTTRSSITPIGEDGAAAAAAGSSGRLSSRKGEDLV